MKVPFFRVDLGEEEKSAVLAVLESGWLTTGRGVQEFEKAFASYVGAPHALAVNSCTAALHLALDAVGVRKGDLVLVPTMTFAATAEVVRYFAARPVLVDCDPVSLCIDPQAAEAAAAECASTGRLKAILPVHYAGQMADMGRIEALAEKYELAVVEDAAHTLPAYIRQDSRSEWRSVGSGSNLTCFSFYANKCITTGEGGMVVAQSQEMLDRMRMMCLHGLSKSAWNRFEAGAAWYYEIREPGFKYNMTDLAAALGIVQLSKADSFWKQRRRVADAYNSALGPLEDFLELPVECENRKSAWHLYSLRLRLEQLDIDRAQFIRELHEQGITCSVHWMPLHLHPYYRRTYHCRPEDCPVASREWLRLVSLPIFPSMKSNEIEHVCNSIRTVISAHARRRVAVAGHAEM